MRQNLQTQKYDLLPLKESENNQKINQDIKTKTDFAQVEHNKSHTKEAKIRKRIHY